jgi:two-component system phosphate regulon response regulator OmpR
MAFDRSIDVHISKLRSKLELYPRFRKVIKTVWGTGYMFVDAP